MADRRMYSKKIVESDAFLDLPASAQALYFHLGMAADDDGVVNAPRGVIRACGAGDEDLKLLEGKGFLLPFPSGIVVIKHWRINNTIQKDRYKPTAYSEEIGQLAVKENGAYTAHVYTSMDTQACIHKAGYTSVDTQIRLVKEKLNKESQGEEPAPAPDGFRPPTTEEVEAYAREAAIRLDAAQFVAYYSSNGWLVGNRTPMRDWKAAARSWAARDKASGGYSPFDRRAGLTAQGYTQRAYAGDMINLFEDEEAST